jgi:hypothetical protein
MDSLRISDTLKMVYGNVVQMGEECFQKIETARERVVMVAHQRCPESLAIVVEKVSTAIPATFVALASLAGGSFTVPAMVLSFGLQVISLRPMIHGFFQAGFSTVDIKSFCAKAWEGFTNTIEEKAVPALFVALTVESVRCYALGWFAADLESMLRATAITMPGAALAFLHMKKQAASGLEKSSSPGPTREVPVKT